MSGSISSVSASVSIPDFCLVVVAGGSAAGRAAFVRRHFSPDEIVAASFECAGAGGGPGHDLPGVLQRQAEASLSQRRLAVVDATHLVIEQRTSLLKLATRHYAEAIAIALAGGAASAAAGPRARADELRRLAKLMERAGFRSVYEVDLSDDAAAATIARLPLWPDRRGEHGPFDIIGDVHGCADELIELMSRLGYAVSLSGTGEDRRADVTSPPGRRAVFVGDLVDRGPRSPDVLRIVMAMVARGIAMAVPGNHDAKFMRWLDGRTVKPTHGLDRTIAQMEADAPGLRGQAREFFRSLGSHLWLEGGRLVVAHAGIAPAMIGRESGDVREFCLYGDNDGVDAAGLPIRYHWAGVYAGETTIVYGHTPVLQAEWVNRTLCLDTGCCFGGALSALRWPEQEVVSVRARETYAERRRPFGHPPLRPAPAQGAGPGEAR